MTTESHRTDIPSDAAAPLFQTLIHFGAGRCRELESHLARQPRRILLIEADPALAEQLRVRTAALPQVEVQCVAIAGQSGPVTLHRYNLPDAHSLHPATGLSQLFPGLRLQERLSLHAQEPASVLEPLRLDPQEEHLLIIDLPGEELPVLEALARTGELDRIGQIQLHCGNEPLYQGSHAATEILRWLEAQCFDVLAQDDRQDPDQPCWTLHRSRLKFENLELQRQLAALRAEQSAWIRERNSCDQEKSTIVAARDEQAQLAAERQQQLAALTAARDEQAQLVAEQQQQLVALTAARDEQAQLAAERQQQIVALTAARDEQAQLAHARQTEFDQQIQQLNANQNRIAQLESQLAEAEQRQILMHEEIYRAESQIELIKDLLLRKTNR